MAETLSTNITNQPTTAHVALDWFLGKSKELLGLGSEESVDLNPIHWMGHAVRGVRDSVSSTFETVTHDIFGATREALGSLFR